MLAVVSLSFCSVNAQQFSLGFRTGASYWMDKQEGKCFSSAVDGQNTTWDKQLFVRYKTRGKIVLEASMGHYAFKNRQVSTEYECIYGENNITAMTARNIYEESQNVEWNLSAQYDLSCPALKEKCPLMKHLKSYMGVELTPTWSRTTTKIGSDESLLSSETNNEWSLWAGLSHTLIYDISDRVYITSALRFQIDPNKFIDKSGVIRNADSRLGFQMGLGYNLQ